jgi:hypothetical protein
VTFSAWTAAFMLKSRRAMPLVTPRKVSGRGSSGSVQQGHSAILDLLNINKKMSHVASEAAGGGGAVCQNLNEPCWTKGTRGQKLSRGIASLLFLASGDFGLWLRMYCTPACSCTASPTSFSTRPYHSYCFYGPYSRHRCIAGHPRTS